MAPDNKTAEELELLLAEARKVQEDAKNTQNQPLTQVPSKPMQNVEDLPVTTLEDLGEYSKGQKVRFPDFSEGQPFIAQVKRPSLLVLSKEGKIPNRLLTSATSMFTGEGNNKATQEESSNALKDMYEVIEIVAEATLIAPSYADIKNAGIQLSDNQLMAIFNYTQNGVKALESFRD